MSKVFIDTNILVYSMDRDEPEKKKKCRQILRTLLDEEHPGVISTQVKQEFFVAATRKLGADPLSVKDIIRSFDGFETVIVTSELIFEAIDCSIINRLSFWDALIIVSAASARCARLLTEDLNDGQIIQGVQIVNPLKYIQN